MENIGSLLVDTERAAAHLGLSVSTLEKWRVSGVGPTYKKIGRSVRYVLAELDAWIAEQTCSSTSEYTERKAA